MMRENLFELNTDGAAAQVWIDPGQPYLRDHDVGQPLFGTALSLEAMAESVQFLQGRVPRRISHVTAGSDCLVSHPMALRCDVKDEGASVQTVLTAGDHLVFRAVMDFSDPMPPKSQQKPAFGQTSTAGESIYRCFFHGPSLRVAARACLWGEAMAVEMAADLPPLVESVRREPLIPMRIIELCLQSAGLLDAATRHCMSVPLSVGMIELYRPVHLDGIWSLAEYSGMGADIRAYNADGQPVLSVLDYRTKPMPYASRDFEGLCTALTQ